MDVSYEKRGDMKTAGTGNVVIVISQEIKNGRYLKKIRLANVCVQKSL